MVIIYGLFYTINVDSFWAIRIFPQARKYQKLICNIRFLKYYSQQSIDYENQKNFYFLDEADTSDHVPYTMEMYPNTEINLANRPGMVKCME